MKFVHKHRSDILDTIKRCDLTEADFDFIKSRGRICIKHRKSGIQFSYLRKQETKLDPITRDWIHSEWFKIKHGKAPEKAVESWQLVIKSLEHWLLTARNDEL